MPPRDQGPLGRPPIPGLPPAMVFGPVDKAIGRARGGMAAKISNNAFVDKLNTTGNSPIGRLSSDYVKKIFPPKKNETIELDPEYTIITGRGPVGRLPPPLPKEKPRKKQDIKPKPKIPENVKWVSAEEMQRIVDAKKKIEPNATADDNAFAHANDLDITNIAYSQKTKVLPIYKDGEDFNINNALNHPERLMQTVTDWDQLQREAELKKLKLANGTTPDPTKNAFFKNMTDGKPIIVDELPGEAGLKSEITGTDKIVTGFEDWQKKWNQTIKLGRQQIGPYEEKLIDDIVHGWTKKYNKSERERCGCLDEESSENSNDGNKTCQCGWRQLPPGQKLIPEAERVRREDKRKEALVQKALAKKKQAEAREDAENKRLQGPARSEGSEESSYGSSSSSYSSSSRSRGSSSQSSGSSSSQSSQSGSSRGADPGAKLDKLNRVAESAQAHLDKLEARRKEIMDKVGAIKASISAIGFKHIRGRIHSRYDAVDQIPDGDEKGGKQSAGPKITPKHAAIAAELHKTLSEQLDSMAKDEKRMQEQIFKTRLQLATLHKPTLTHIRQHMNSAYDDYTNWGAAVAAKRQQKGANGGDWRSSHEAIHERIRSDYGGRRRASVRID